MGNFRIGVEGHDGNSAAGRLFLRNLPYGATEVDLAALLSEFGDLSEVHLVVDRWDRNQRLCLPPGAPCRPSLLDYAESDLQVSSRFIESKQQ